MNVIGIRLDLIPLFLDTGHFEMIPQYGAGLAAASGGRRQRRREGPLPGPGLPGVAEHLGDTAADFIALVQTLRLVNIDQPLAEDEAPFKERLTDALQRQVEAAARCPDIDLTPVQSKL